MNPTHNVSSEAISKRAHQLWEAAGRPDGAHNEHWLQAERELTQSSNHKDGSEHASVEPNRKGNPAPDKAPHSTNYQHPGVTTDSLHHHRQG